MSATPGLMARFGVASVASRWRGAAGRLVRRTHRFSWALADQCTVSAVNFLSVWLFARHLDASVFGMFILAHIGLMLLTNLQNALLVQPHNVLAAGLAPPEYRSFTAALALAQAALCLLACLVLAAVGGLILPHAPESARLLVALAAVSVPWMGQEFVRRVLYTRGETRAVALNDALSYGLQLAGAAAIAIHSPQLAGPETALLVFGFGSAAGVVLGLRQLRSHIQLARPGRAAFVMRSWRETWQFGKWLIAQNAVAWFGAHGHSWIVGILLGAGQVGLYRAATHLVNLMNPLLQTCFSYLPSRGSIALKEGGRAGLARWVRRMLPVLLLAPLPFCVLLVGFPEWVLRLAYGERYVGGQMPLILSLAAVAACVNYAKFPFDIGLLALRSTRSIFAVYLIPVALLLTSGVALIRFLGILGVPLSSLIINSALLVATWLAYRRRLAAPESASQGAPR